MKHLLPKFSVAMPGAKVKWPFEKKEDVQCVHIGLGHVRRKFFVHGAWLCEECKLHVDRFPDTPL